MKQRRSVCVENVRGSVCCTRQIPCLVENSLFQTPAVVGNHFAGIWCDTCTCCSKPLALIQVLMVASSNPGSRALAASGSLDELMYRLSGCVGGAWPRLIRNAREGATNSPYKVHPNLRFRP